jgi:hypothetical protein
MGRRRLGRWSPALPVFVGVAFLGSFFAPSHKGSPAVSEPLASVDSQSQGKMLQVGEELQYRVSYSFFNIGTIRIQVLDKEERNGRTLYRALALMDSNPSLSWLLELHVRFLSELDDSIFSYMWISDDSSDHQVDYKRFRFDYENNRVYNEKGKKLPSGERTIESVDTLSINGRCQDGLSLLFYARENVRQKRQVHVPTLVEKKEEFTDINFMNKRTDIEVDAIDYPVDVVAFDGEAEYVGIFGLTGGFRGWFSNDDARVPILARMNVILGSIKIQLEKWNRPGWQPPKYVEEPGN